MEFFNADLAEKPLNWAIVWVFASVTLLLMHVVMTAFGAMQAPTPETTFGPGQQLATIAGSGSNFSTPGNLANPPAMSGRGSSLSSWFGGGVAAGDGTWTDGLEGKYAEDGWSGNP